MKRVKIIVACATLGTLFIGYLMFAGSPDGIFSPWYDNPHMKWQPHLRSFDAPMPPPPAGAVPVTQTPPLPSAQQAATMTNPLLARGTPAPEDYARGGVYYNYYCTFCHGPAGDGNGPVGQSYVPRPSDLRSAKIRGYSDGQLLRAMLLGPGHEPVLERTVNPDHRWYLVLYVRSLSQK